MNEKQKEMLEKKMTELLCHECQYKNKQCLSCDHQYEIMEIQSFIKQVDQAGWNPYPDKKPEETITCIVTYKLNDGTLMTRQNKFLLGYKEFEHYNNKVTAWQPLPATYVPRETNDVSQVEKGEKA